MSRCCVLGAASRLLAIAALSQACVAKWAGGEEEQFVLAQGTSDHAPTGVWPDVLWRGDVHGALEACSSSGTPIAAAGRCRLAFKMCVGATIQQNGNQFVCVGCCAQETRVAQKRRYS